MKGIAREIVMRRHHTSTTAEVVSFSAGALVGAGIALLYAPKTGHEMREELSDATGNAISKMKGYTAEAQDKLQRNLQKGREFAEERVSSLASEGEEVKEQYH